jgi:hypothetical protein
LLGADALCVLAVLAAHLSSGALLGLMLLGATLSWLDIHHTVLVVTGAERILVGPENSKRNRVGLEVDNQSITLELALVVGIHLDARGLAVRVQGNNAAPAGELFEEFINRDIQRQVGDVDSGVLGRLLLLGLLVLTFELDCKRELAQNPDLPWHSWAGSCASATWERRPQQRQY